MNLRDARLYVVWLTLPIIVIGYVVLYSASTNEVGTLQKDVPGGDAKEGKALINYYGCGSCHRIEGIGEAGGMAGAPLDEFWKREYIVGNLVNNTENLVALLLDPQAFEPGTIMPDVGLNEEQARHIAAYLYSD
jgi:cytochrome c